MSLSKCLTLRVPQMSRIFSNKHICNLKTGKTLCNGIFITTRGYADKAGYFDILPGRSRVYYGPLTPQIRTVKWFSLSTSAVGLICQPFIYGQLSALNNLPLVIAGCSFVGFFTFLTPFLLHHVTKKYVTHLDYQEDTDTYIATTVNFFCALKEYPFKVEDVVVPELPGMFTSIVAKGKPLFFDPRSFSEPEHYRKIMGYDKPMDFKLYKSDEPEKT